MKTKYIAYIKWIAFFAVLIALCISISKCSSYKRQYENSYREYRDTIAEYVNKYNDVYAMNNAYITDLNTLKQENKELYDEVKSLRDNPIIVTKVKTVYVLDTIVMEQELISDTVSGDFYADITYADDWNSFNGRFDGNIFNNTSKFTLNDMQFNCSLTTDLIERNGKLYFITKSDNPYLKITDMDGYLVSPEKSKVLKKTFNKPWGIMLGVGGTAGLYDGKVVLVPGVNVTVGYKILSF